MLLTHSLLALQISELASIKKHGNSLLLSKDTKNTRKTEKTVASGKINLQSKHDPICLIAKVKVATSVHSMADVIPFLGYLLFLLNSML